MATIIISLLVLGVIAIIFKYGSDILKGMSFIISNLRTIAELNQIMVDSVEGEANKDYLLRDKKKGTIGAILDQEIEIEENWKILKQGQEELDQAKEKVKDNLKLIEEEKSKTPMSMEVCQKLIAENIRLGWDNKKLEYNNNGKVALLENKIEYCRGTITKLVATREMLKMKLSAINSLIKSGIPHVNFEETLEEIAKNDKERQEKIKEQEEHKIEQDAMQEAIDEQHEENIAINQELDDQATKDIEESPKPESEETKE